MLQSPRSLLGGCFLIVDVQLRSCSSDFSDINMPTMWIFDPAPTPDPSIHSSPEEFIALFSTREDHLWNGRGVMLATAFQRCYMTDHGIGDATVFCMLKTDLSLSSRVNVWYSDETFQAAQVLSFDLYLISWRSKMEPRATNPHKRCNARSMKKATWAPEPWRDKNRWGDSQTYQRPNTTWKT